MPLPTAKAIEVLGFVPYESVDPVRISSDMRLEGLDGFVDQYTEALEAVI